MSDTVSLANYGMLPTGFSRMRMPEIRQTIIDTLNTRIGVTFETRPDSITGQFIDVFAEREATMWEVAEAVYHAMYPISAFGVSLDHSVAFSGVRRLFAEQSTVWCACFGTEGTVIPAGSLVRSNVSQDNFLLDNDVTISRQLTADGTVTPSTAVVGQTYSIQINGVGYSHVAIAGDTQLSIAAELYVKLQASGFEVELDAVNVRIWTIESASFNLQISSNMAIVKLSSPGHFTAEDFGSIPVAAHTIDQIVSTLDGWTEVDNNSAGAEGRSLESDDELRLRYDRGVFRLGAGTVDSIRANLQQNIIGILTVNVYENVSDVIDADGRKPHSIEVIAHGGDTLAIANEIWRTKPAGIDTNGLVSTQVTDAQGYQHTVLFNRPQLIYVWVKVVVTLYDEEVFPDDGIYRIQTIVEDVGNSFGIGKDIIVQRFFGPIYSQVQGIATLTISIATNTDPEHVPTDPEYSTANHAISARQLSRFFYENVFVDAPISRTTP